MTAFTVTVRQPGQTAAQALTIDAIGSDSIAVHMAMIDQFGVCVICIRPLTAPQ